MHVAHHLDLIYMPAKYYKNISKGIKVIDRISFCLWTDGQTDIQEGHSEVPNGLWPLQIYAVYTLILTSPYTSVQIAKPHNVSWACTDRCTDARLTAISPEPCQFGDKNEHFKVFSI